MTQDISIMRGRTKSLNVTITGSDGLPYILGENEKLIFGAKANISDKTYAIRKIATAADYDQETSTYVFSIGPADTIDLSVDTPYYYDIGLQNGSDYYTVIETSKLTLLGNVTRKE